MAKRKNSESKDAGELVRKNGKRARISQSDVPRVSLRKAVRLAESLRDNFGGKSAAPHQLAIAIDLSPTSSTWQFLCGASIAYGITSGGYGASEISLTDLGKRIVLPTSEGDDAAAKVEASLKPRIPREFFEKYDKSKFPQDKIAKNVLIDMGVPSERAEECLSVIKENGNFVRSIIETKTGLFVALDRTAQTAAFSDSGQGGTTDLGSGDGDNGTPHTHGQVIPPAPKVSTPKNNNVFIAHGKNTEIVEQLKKLLVFGRFEPVVAVEHETIAVSVPDKVVRDMRKCTAGILHLCSEETLLDSQSNPVHRLNENVLIEIGAAMALYDHNFILLVEKGIHVPSNLQGLQRCEYEGSKLDVDATMKLLAAFNEFK